MMAWMLKRSFWSVATMICSIFFFFSSRRRHTRYWRDWSSDVCSSDLLYLGQADVTIARQQTYHAILALLGVEIAFHRRRSGAQERPGAIHLGQNDGRAAGMIAWCGVLLLETRLVFLVNNDQSELLKGQENRTPGTQNNVIGMAGELLIPYLHTLSVAVFAMIYAQSVAKYPLQTAGYLHRERYFGQQIEHLLMVVERLLNEVNVHFGLATRRHSVEQHHGFRQELQHYLVVSVLLWLAKGLYQLGMRLTVAVESAHGLLISIKKSAVGQRLDNGRGAARGIHQFLPCNLHDGLSRRRSLDRIPSRER